MTQALCSSESYECEMKILGVVISMKIPGVVCGSVGQLRGAVLSVKYRIVDPTLPLPPAHTLPGGHRPRGRSDSASADFDRFVPP
jgi:hypothetical protein